MYNHLPKVDPTRSLDGAHRPTRSEVAVMRRMHREELAAQRAQARDQQGDAVAGTRRLAHPVALLWGLVGSRR